VLVVRRDRVRNRVPTVPGGGTVAFVGPAGHRYLDDPAAREEGGTPGIVESIRPGLVVTLKQAVGTDLIQAREQRFLRRAVRAPAARHRPDRSRALDELVGRGHLGVKPGWVRVSFNYFISDAGADCLVEAVDLLATSGHRLLGDYRFDPRSGGWRHRSGPAEPAVTLTGLLGLDAHDAQPPGSVRRPTAGEDALAGYLEHARRLLAARPDRRHDAPDRLPAEQEALREFHLPPAG
jgi:hypothetical protein